MASKLDNALTGSGLFADNAINQGAAKKAAGEFGGRSGGTAATQSGRQGRPVFTSALNYYAFILGGRENLVALARQSESEEVKQFIAQWDATPKYKRPRVDLEALCVLANLPVSRLLGEITVVATEQSIDMSNLLAAVNHPKVVQKTIDLALKPKGVADRKMLHQHAGFLPVPKSAIVNIRNTVATQMTSGGHDSALPSFEQESMAMTKVIRGELPESTETET